MIVTLKVDEKVRVGRDIVAWPTDIDPTGVRLVARGRVLGGPTDGERFDVAHELAVGAAAHLGPHVAVTLVEVRGQAARFTVFAPANVSVERA